MWAGRDRGSGHKRRKWTQTEEADTIEASNELLIDNSLEYYPKRVQVIGLRIGFPPGNLYPRTELPAASMERRSLCCGKFDPYGAPPVTMFLTCRANKVIFKWYQKFENSCSWALIDAQVHSERTCAMHSTSPTICPWRQLLISVPHPRLHLPVSESSSPNLWVILSMFLLGCLSIAFFVISKVWRNTQISSQIRHIHSKDLH